MVALKQLTLTKATAALPTNRAPGINSGVCFDLSRVPFKISLNPPPPATPRPSTRCSAENAVIIGI